MENLDEETMAGLKEMGAFGLQVLKFVINYHANKQKMTLLQLFQFKSCLVTLHFFIRIKVMTDEEVLVIS